MYTALNHMRTHTDTLYLKVKTQRKPQQTDEPLLASPPWQQRGNLQQSWGQTHTVKQGIMLTMKLRRTCRRTGRVKIVAIQTCCCPSACQTSLTRFWWKRMHETCTALVSVYSHTHRVGLLLKWTGCVCVHTLAQCWSVKLSYQCFWLK